MCDSKSIYGDDAAYTSKNTGGHGHATEGAKHITKQEHCPGSKMKRSVLKKGDELKMTAYYDLEKHPGMKRNEKEWDEVMAISGVFVRMKGN
jgi:hypothetical protein